MWGVYYMPNAGSSVWHKAFEFEDTDAWKAKKMVSLIRKEKNFYCVRAVKIKGKVHDKVVVAKRKYSQDVPSEHKAFGHRQAKENFNLNQAIVPPMWLLDRIRDYNQNPMGELEDFLIYRLAQDFKLDETIMSKKAYPTEEKEDA